MIHKNVVSGLLICLIPFFFLSCKEKNELYPPLPWGYYFFENEQAASRPISAFLIENDHSEWYGSLRTEGILYYDGYTWQEMDNSSVSIPFDSVTSIIRDGNGLLWVAWKKGLASFDGDKWKSIPELNGRRVNGLALQGVGIIWAGIDGDAHTGGLVRFQSGDLKFFTPDNSEIPFSHITSLTIDHDQQLWAGSANKGIAMFNGSKWKTLSCEAMGLAPTRINCLVTDMNGNVWAGTESSHIIKFTGSEHITLNTGTGSPITSLAMTMDETTWIGTNGSGILSLSDNNWSAYTKENMHLPGDSILTLGIHPDGRLLVSFIDGHIVYFK
jgi:ligand-binding sensor domain-containing protein